MIRTERKRRLAALLFTDIVGYSALTGRDELLSLDLVEEHHAIVRQTVSRSGGSEVKSTGDGFLFEFPSVVDAVRTAIEVQTRLFERNLTVPAERQLQIRIGVHLGDIFDSNDDFHGNEVNVAARIEPLARPGGVAISNPVADQIKGKLDLDLRSLGRPKLKNIANPPEVFQIRMPWDRRRPSVASRILSAIRPKKGDPSLYSTEGRLLVAQVVGLFFLIAWMVFRVTTVPALTVDTGPNRVPEGMETSPAESVRAGFVLPTNWQYALGRSPSPTLAWKRFPIDDPMRVADEIEGEYLLRLTFPSEQEFYHPTLVIGLIADTHRVYLNGKFIGGSPRFSELAKYPFDPSILRPEGQSNELIVRANARPGLNPGIYRVPNATPFVSDFEVAAAVIEHHENTFHLLQSIYLAVSLLVALASLIYSFIRRKNLKYLYYSAFLFLGSLGLSFYSREAIAALDFPIYRWIHLVAFAWSSATLFSIELRARGQNRAERWNNGGALSFAVLTAATLVAPELSPSAFYFGYRMAFLSAAIYSVTWLTFVAVTSFRAWAPDRSLGFGSADTRLTLPFGALLALLSAASAFRGVATQAGIYPLLRAASLVYPFGFALYVFFNGVVDYVKKAHELDYQRRKSDLLLWISAILDGEHARTENTLGTIQRKVMEFLAATRSTVYLYEELPGESGILRAHSVEGTASSRDLVASEIDLTSGIIGYCVQNRCPVLVENIESDARFHSVLDLRGGIARYETGSFIVLPLYARESLLGVITVADRADGVAFTEEDFGILHLAGKGLAALLNRDRVPTKVAKIRLVA